MRVGFFRRLASFLLDAMPIVLVLSLLLSLFVGNILKSQYEDYDRDLLIYQENMDTYYDELNDYKDQYEAEEITVDEYNTLSTALRDDFTNDNEELISMVFSYYVNASLYFLISFSVIYYIYNLLLKGQTYGRKLMKIELYGKITWFTLLLRELLWKPVFWVFTFGIGLAVDVGLITFTKKKKTIRDYLSETEIRFSGVSYPF